MPSLIDLKDKQHTDTVLHQCFTIWISPPQQHILQKPFLNASEKHNLSDFKDWAQLYNTLKKKNNTTLSFQLNEHRPNPHLQLISMAPLKSTNLRYLTLVQELTLRYFPEYCPQLGLQM